MIIFYLLVLASLGIYSYSQIDLNLTLLQTPWFLSFQNTMIQLGYYNRPLSTFIFLFLVLVLFSIFYLLSSRALSGRIGKREIIILIVGVCFVGLVSYPAFSHDIFNYMFDAKILTHYGQNPYLFKALDFPADPWLRFMHWTHRTYPYGPVWLLATAPLSLLGFGKFILTLLNFKLFFVAVYLLNIKLLQKISSSKSALIFALNPLVIIESLISPHIDVLMTLGLLIGVYYWQKNSKPKAIIALLFSGGTKFVTLLLVPLFGWRKLSFEKLISVSIVVLLATVALVISQRAPYPWYFLPILALISLLAGNKNWYLFGFLLSLGAILTYAPYLFTGSYPQEVITAEYILFLFPLLVFLVARNIAIRK